MEYSMERLFNRKHSERPLWLCIVVFVLIIVSSLIVLTDFAGCLDFVFRSEPIEVETLRVEEFDDTFIGKALPFIEKRAERGRFSYYMEAYPIITAVEVIDMTKDTTVAFTEYVSDRNKLATQEEKDKHDEENRGSIEKLASEVQSYKDNLEDRINLSALLITMYRIVSFILALCIWRLHSGLGVKILYKIYSRKLRWIM